MNQSDHNTQMRRQDRAVHDEAWIKALLQRAPAGVLAASNDDQPYLNTVMFLYHEDAHAIYIHSARSGRLVDMLAANERVCFTAFEMGRLLPAEVVLNFSVEYASVIVFGRAVLVTDEAEAHPVLQQMLDKYFPHLVPGEAYRTPTAKELNVPAVYRIEIEAWSGKQKVAADDAPGAFLWGHVAPIPFK